MNHESTIAARTFRRRGVRAVSVGVVLSLLVPFVGSCGSGDGAPAEKAPAEPVGRVLVIGLDGADWDILDRLAREGGIPNLSRLMDEGARGILRSRQPLLSPILWTTMATGRSPLDHGIVGFLSVRDGRTEPVRSSERRVRAFWNVLGDHGRSVGVVGWYATWPAEPVDGFLVSDRVGTHQVSSDAAELPERSVHPPELTADVGELRARMSSTFGAAEAARFFRAGSEAGTTIDIDRATLDTFVAILATTETYRHLFPELLRRYEPDVAAVYLEGTDAVGHLFAAYQEPPLPTVDPELAFHLAPAFDRYYTYVDQVIGEWLDNVDPAETTVMVVSDHGFRTGTKRPNLPPRTTGGDPAPLWHRPEGIVLLWGRGIRPGATIEGASIEDVGPTVLRLAGVPLSEELDGRPIDDALDAAELARPVRTVASYETGSSPAGATEPEAQADDVIAKLRALGYVGGSPASRLDPESGAEGQMALPINRYNLGVILTVEGEFEAALRVFRDLQRDAPDLPLGWLGEATVHRDAGRDGAANRALEEARTRGFDGP